MPFQLTFSDSFHADMIRRGSDYVVAVRVGIDRERRTNYFIEVGLSAVPGCNYLEYHFCLIGVPAEGEPEFYWSGKAVPGDISKEDRKKILNVVLSATETLLGHVQPKSVFRITYDESPPAGALAKHDAVCVTFGRCGYEVGAADAYQGKRTWMMERVSSSE